MLLLSEEVIPLETAAAVSPDPTLILESLNQELALLTDQLAQLSTIQPTLDADVINWPEVMQPIRNYNSNQLTLLNLTQSGNQIILQGRAVNEEVVSLYVQQLEQSGVFSRVGIQSLIEAEQPFVPPTPTAVLPTFTPVPTNEPTPTPSNTPIPNTATPDLRDEFEWDNQQAKPIFVGAPQTHNFFPNFDEDNVFFLAKAGRTYQISTSRLAAGVDTFLTVTIGETTLTNDDAEFGTLASMLQIQAPPDEDINVFVRISNRGVYGSAATYTISVDEIVVTPTPTASPEPAATETPDLRDEFEPDDPPTLIAVNESQFHNFYPSADEDHLQLLVKGGANYQIVTSNLAVGVDTVVEVEWNSIVTENDDFGELNDLSSSLCFSVQNDGVALIDIRNKSQQYGVDKTYTVSANEVPFSLDTSSIDFGTLAENSPTIFQTVQLSSSALITWTAVVDQPWLQLNKAVGTTPDSIEVGLNPAGMGIGPQQGAVSLEWEGVCSQVIPISVQIEAATTEDNGGWFNTDHVLMSGNRPGRILTKRVFIQTQGAVEFVIVVELSQ